MFATDAAGAVVWAQAYDPFGRVVSGLGSDIRFAGQWFAAENGLHQNWMRDYDATLGRYIQPDPLGLVDVANVYGYVGGNPARFIDPKGEHKKDKWYGYDNREFQRWFHKCWKQAGNADADKEEIEEAYQEWVDRGRPSNGKCDNAPACNNCSNVDAADVIIGGGLAYLGYRCLRMIPSLLPPLWGTIPSNLAIP